MEPLVIRDYVQIQKGRIMQPNLPQELCALQRFKITSVTRSSLRTRVSSKLGLPRRKTSAGYVSKTASKFFYQKMRMMASIEA
ncbi:hypothetical protein PGT21_028122 [Puccinia graminis f. sp. tritici]|uniref:Uncharacterized protein n=1 Tax=Puccinia graminis f. sp. tritici TaxID=56615 RepID=A0A5B0Q6S0_PUCGR|nr:hypothetical protein PGT21_028122 [Puccinia graminis f. sp. tritici]KAA1122392.1 hypothetical protein PGTUg99_037381 [Puccinia graminis f. sp. tritici]